jgi:D-alanyl-D-alanine carboxypeptidase
MGMRNTTFKNANGLTATGHLSSAHDMAILGRRLVYDFPQYYNLFSRGSTSAGIKTVRNTNRRLLDSYKGADGIKTGYTRAAGFNLVSSAQRGDKRVIVAVFGGRSSASRDQEVVRLMDVGFDRMPRYARFTPLPSLRRTASAIASTSGASVGAVASVQVAALTRSTRPMPRSAGRSGPIARNSESIAAAIAEVNAELSASTAASRGIDIEAMKNRPAPRPGPGDQAAVRSGVGSASTFASAPAAPTRAADTVVASLPSASSTSTGGNSWGVQIGVHRAKGDAERQLLTTALKDVPQLNGGLRRIEAATVSGVTIYRAQFVGLSQEGALSACRTLVELDSDCAPIAPGT